MSAAANHRALGDPASQGLGLLTTPLRNRIQAATGCARLRAWPPSTAPTPLTRDVVGHSVSADRAPLLAPAANLSQFFGLHAPSLPDSHNNGKTLTVSACSFPIRSMSCIIGFALAQLVHDREALRPWSSALLLLNWGVSPAGVWAGVREIVASRSVVIQGMASLVMTAIAGHGRCTLVQRRGSTWQLIRVRLYRLHSPS